MRKLLTAYQANPCLANARKLVKHLDKYMMAECLASVDESRMIADARSLVARFVEG